MIYFIQQGHTGPIKIGFSKNPGARIRELQTSHHAQLRMLGEIDGSLNDERRLHEKFANHRIRREWFAPTQDLMDYIRSVLDENPFLDWFDKDHQESEAKYRATEGHKLPREISDLEIIPPRGLSGGWIVRSKQADLAIFEKTLEDALFAFTNDCTLGNRFGWDALRFPVVPKEDE